MTDRSCTTKNVLCIGCHEGGESKCVGDLVSSSSWDILLHRIGDLLMCYILRHSSIFLSVKKNDYFQVSGLPLNVILQEPIFTSAMTRDRQPCSKKENCSMCYMWGKKERALKLSGGNSVHDSNSLDAKTCKFDALQISGNYGTASITEPNCSPEGCNSSRIHSISKSTMCSSLYAQNPSKRKRLYKWQRYNKQKKICREDKPSVMWIDEVHSLDPTEDTNSVTMNCDVNYSHTKESSGIDVLSSELFPSSVFRPSQCPCYYSTSRCQPTCPLLLPPSLLHVNTSPICFECLILNSCKYLSADSLIPRHTIFYNRRTSYNIFHGNHILNKRKRPDAFSLIKHIFGIKKCCAKFLKCVIHESTTASSNCLCLLKLMKNLTRNSRRCQYKKLFLKHCPVKSKVATIVANNNRNSQYPIGGNSPDFDQSFAQLEAYSTHQQVVSFIWAVLTRIVPEPLLGNSNSKRSLRINICRFIELRRFETFHLCDCIHELKVSDYSWISNIMSSCCSAQMVREIGLSNGSDEQICMNLLQCWINWLFSDVMIPLIRAYFYTTERESRRYDVFYYPKAVWRDLTSDAIASLNGQNFKILHGTSRRAMKHLCCSSRVRFVPKANDMRPLVNLKAQSKNGFLNKCHLIIKKVRDENPEIFGSSVFDYNNVHKNLSHFISSVRSHLKERYKMYIVVADVSKAFDCICQDMVLKVTDSALKYDDYVMRRCIKVVCNRSKNAIYRFNSNFCVSNGDNINDFSIQLSSGGGILVDQGKTSTIRKKEVQHFLSEQVKRNILKIGQNFYLQKVGIAQGSKLSSNLCCLYYGHLENSVLLKFLHDGKINSAEDVSSVPNSLLMRFIDDFIFISFSKKHALDFFNRMRRGFVYYNCYMNNRKYGFNFEVPNSDHCCNRIYRGDDGLSFIPWSGLLVNCETLEIQADYTRYLDIVISSTITVKKYCSTKYLQNKLCHYMRPKCHPIFYDSRINSSRTVRLNLYQAFMLCAMKFHCYVHSMPDIDIRKPEFVHIIKRTFRYMHSLIIRRTQEVELQYSVRPVLKLRRKEIMWLGLSAYLRVLQKKQSRYKDLLALLTAEIGRYCHLDHDSDSLRYAVDDSHSSMFLKFKF